MARFRYYITELFNGKIVGTNDSAVAEDYAGSEDCFVVDTITGEWLQPNGNKVSVEEA